MAPSPFFPVYPWGYIAVFGAKKLDIALLGMVFLDYSLYFICVSLAHPQGGFAKSQLRPQVSIFSRNPIFFKI